MDFEFASFILRSPKKNAYLQVVTCLKQDLL